METRRKALLKKLLNTQHLNVPERKELGENPSFKELLGIVDEHFSEFRFLPESVKEWQADKFCYEGFVLEKKEAAFGPYILHYQEVGPALDLRESIDNRFQNLESALIVYFQKAYRNNIDGIPIIFD